MSSFIKHSFTMFRGAMLGQIIPVALLPVISRLYGPESYGIFAGILGVSGVLAAMGALRLEVAIVLPEDDAEALTIQRSAIRLALAMAVLFTILFAALEPFVTGHLGVPDIGYWLCAAPVLAFLMTMTQIGGYAATRHRDYGAIASSTVGIQLVNGVAGIGLGLIGAGAGGLAAARVLGQACGVAQLRRHFAGFRGAADMRGVLAKYRKFPLFNMPYSLIGTFTREFLILALTAFHQPAAAGFYGMARAAMLMPVSLVASSLGQVFYREAARSIDHPDFRHFAYALMLAAGCLVAPVLGTFTLWDAQVFGIVFGAEWATAGLYASLFVPVAVLFTLTSWPERVFEVRGRQDIPLFLQVIFDGATIVAVVMTLRSGAPAMGAVMVFVGIQCVYHLAYLAFVFRCLGMGALKYAFLLMCVGAAGLSPYSLDWGLSRIIAAPLPLFIAETAIMGGLCVAGLIHTIRAVGRFSGFIGNHEKAG